jgi:chromosome segregation ATPase
MALDDLEVNLGNGTSFKGVYVAVLISFATTIGSGLWAASEFFSRLEAQEVAVQEATAQAEILLQRFEDLRELNAQRLQKMDTRLSNMTQAMDAADVENLQGKLGELGATLAQIMDAQKELLDLRDRISTVERTASESEIKVSTRLESLQSLDARLKRFERDMDDLWLAIDATNPLGG